MNRFFCVSSFLLVFTISYGQSGAKIDFEAYEPNSTLVVSENKLTKAKFPFIDVHNHQGNMPSQDLGPLVQEMEKLNMAVMVNLSGQGGDRLKQSIRNVKENYPKRFIVFANIDFKGIGESKWTENAVRQLEEDVKNG